MKLGIRWLVDGHDFLAFLDAYDSHKRVGRIVRALCRGRA